MGNRIVDWSIKLDPNEPWDLDLLVEHFQSPACRVEKDVDGIGYLKSDLFRELQSHNDVIPIARKVMIAMNAAAKVLSEGFRPVNAGTLFSFSESGVRNTVIMTGPLTFRIPTTIPPREPAKDSRSVAETWVELAQADEDVAEALCHFVFETDWPTLFKVYETVEKSLGQRNRIWQLDLATRENTDRFVLTAHSERHAKSRPAPDSMTINEGREFVRALLDKWMRRKASTS